MPPQMLRGMRVLELASVLAGPSVGQYLGELGAEVLKVENLSTGGDVTRTWLLNGEDREGCSAYFHAANMGKKSIAVDARLYEGRDLIHQLVEKSDVVLCSYKPGDAKKLSLDYDTLKAINDKIVYAGITGYGAQSTRAGYDAIIQAESGFQYINGTPDSLPTKLPVALMDLLAAHQLKQAILLSLWQRDRTGTGSEVSVSLIQSAVSALANQGTGYLKHGVSPQRMGSDHPSICPYGSIFETNDGKLITLAVGSDKQFASLCEVLGLEVREEFRTNPSRVQNREACKAYIRDSIEQHSLRNLLASLELRSVPAGAVNTIPDVYDMPQAASLVARQPDGTFTGVYQSAVEYSSSSHVPTPAPPPAFSQHATEILTKVLGKSEDQVRQLVESKVVGI